MDQKYNCTDTVSPRKREGKDYMEHLKKNGLPKFVSNYHTIALISHASKVMLKIPQARLQQYVNRELPDVHDGFRKGRGIRDQIATIEKAREFQENIFMLY